MKKMKILFLVVAGAAFITTSQASIIASYEFTGGVLAPTTQQFGTASAVTLGSAFVAQNDNLFYEANIGTPEPGDPSNQVVFNFTVGGLNADEFLEIDSLELDYASVSGTTRFNAYLDDAAGANPTASFRSGGNFNPENGNGSYLELLNPNSNAAAGQTAFSNGDTFSVAFGTRDGNRNAADHTIDNLRLNATIIPEVSHSAILLGGLSILTIFPRRRAVKKC